MRKLKKILLVLFCALLIFVAHILISTGFFRTIEPQFDGIIAKKVAIRGAEDIIISKEDGFALISSTDRAARIRKRKKTGGLFLVDLEDKNFTPLKLSDQLKGSFWPHGISLYKKDSTYQILAINHANREQTIEVFELNGKELKHTSTLKDPAMIQPNDVVQVGENQFYFTNDHKYLKGFGRFAEDYLGFGFSNVVYYDGNSYREVASGIAYANGINYDPDRNLLFVASPRGFLVKVYETEKDGSLSFIEDIPCGTGVDNIEFDEEGNLWIGSHPNLLRFSAYAAGKKETSPSEIIKIAYRKKGDYTVEKIYVETGEDMSASTVAATYNNLIFVGNVMDDNFLILEKGEGAKCRF